MVSLDSDRSDFAKVVRRAVEEDEPCGLVQYSEPDFESANFDRRELADLIWEIVSGSVPAGRRSEVEAAVMEAPANRILDAVRTVAPEITLKKGAEWGRLLMRYALAHPLQRVTGVRRPILDALEAAVNANTASFHSTRSRFRLDPATGRLEPRPGAQPADPPAEN
jgi:hypothetical protein